MATLVLDSSVPTEARSQDGEYSNDIYFETKYYDHSYNEVDKPTAEIFFRCTQIDLSNSLNSTFARTTTMDVRLTYPSNALTCSDIDPIVSNDIHTLNSYLICNYSSIQLITTREQTKPNARDDIISPPSLRSFDTKNTIINGEITNNNYIIINSDNDNNPKKKSLHVYQVTKPAN